MALAIHFQQLPDTGAVADASTLARLAKVTQPRMTQILNRNLLAPDIPEELLLREASDGRRLAIYEKGLRSLARMASWVEQREWIERVRAGRSHAGAAL